VGTITVSDVVMSKLKELAVARGIDVPGVLAEAIGLEVALVRAQRSGSRMLIEKHGLVEELVPRRSDPTA
jgi:hypothetical protein